MASSLDCPGSFSRTVKDSALLYEVMNGEDEKDSTTIPGKDIIDSKIWETKDLK
jgi:aspartyl-tRNA(Asn)/glutamyl-tRNA(Gln) amidotransferase subunit A